MLCSSLNIRTCCFSLFPRICNSLFRFCLLLSMCGVQALPIYFKISSHAPSTQSKKFDILQEQQLCGNCQIYFVWTFLWFMCSFDRLFFLLELPILERKLTTKLNKLEYWQYFNSLFVLNLFYFCRFYVSSLMMRVIMEYYKYMERTWLACECPIVL